MDEKRIYELSDISDRISSLKNIVIEESYIHYELKSELRELDNLNELTNILKQYVESTNKEMKSLKNEMSSLENETNGLFDTIKQQKSKLELAIGLGLQFSVLGYLAGVYQGFKYANQGLSEEWITHSTVLGGIVGVVFLCASYMVYKRSKR